MLAMRRGQWCNQLICGGGGRAGAAPWQVAVVMRYSRHRRGGRMDAAPAFGHRHAMDAMDAAFIVEE